MSPKYFGNKGPNGGDTSLSRRIRGGTTTIKRPKISHVRRNQRTSPRPGYSRVVQREQWEKRNSTRPIIITYTHVCRAHFSFPDTVVAIVARGQRTDTPTHRAVSFQTIPASRRSHAEISAAHRTNAREPYDTHTVRRRSPKYDQSVITRRPGRFRGREYTITRRL